MPTTVTSSIGTASRDYSTIQSWEDACPADLVADDKIWRGECYNDSELGGVGFSGITSDATRYVDLTAAAGQSFQDHPSVRTNPLTYDQSKGVGLLLSASYQTALNVSGVVVAVSRLQVSITGNSNAAFGIERLKDCLLHGTGFGGSVHNDQNGTSMINVVVIMGTSSSGSGILLGNNYFSVPIFCLGVTVIRPSDAGASATGFESHAGGGPILQSCCSFGFSTASSGTFDTITSKNNATDQAFGGLPGSNNQYSVPYSSSTPFVDADSSGGLDLRAITATALAASGFRDATNAPNDISGFSRVAAPYIGHWEVDDGALKRFVLIPS